MKRTTRDFLDQGRIALTVGVFRRHSHRNVLTCLLAFQRLLEPRDQIAVAMQIDHGLRPIRTIDDLPGVVLEGVVDGDDSVLCD